MEPLYNRRQALAATAGVLLGAARAGADTSADSKGLVVGHPEAAKAGRDVLAAGGNAVDAAVAAALVAGVVAPHLCGIGGYGGHLIVALSGSKKVTAIDFNSTAPAAAREDLFPLDERGRVKGQVNTHGWLAAGVPGTLAGLQLALDRFGTRPFHQLVQPALRFARDGFPVEASLVRAVTAMRAQLARDPASAALLLDRGEPPKPGDILRNPDLAAMLETLAQARSVEPFYRGDIARRIAAAFAKHGGLVTAADLGAYRAREVEPLELTWRGYSIRTPPPTAGGTTVLQALAILKDLGWERWEANESRALRARLEALRLAWDDRLKLLGDRDKGPVPVDRLLGKEHVKRQAERVAQALRDGKPVAAETDGRPAGGTVHLSAADAKGNLAALTLTHGGSFGACVTVEGLGLTLGHGMSRFDPRPGWPNSPGPGKRPLHNMCPTVVLKDGRPVLAVGGRGGRRIPNAVFEVLAQVVGRGASLEDGLAAPRLHTEGGMTVVVEPRWREADVEALKRVGYTVERGASAVVSVVAVEPAGTAGGSR